jgi:asparagine synthase (glutamine-hydrolysing)
LAGQLWRKCRSQPEHGQFSNADNMALVGVLSTQLLHHQFVRNRPTGQPPAALKTDVDRARGLES